MEDITFGEFVAESLDLLKGAAKIIFSTGPVSSLDWFTRINGWLLITLVVSVIIISILGRRRK